MFQAIIESINYVTSASFFYPAMGMTTATSIFVGAAIYNGEIKYLSKGLITIGTYAVLVIITNLSRVSERLFSHDIPMMAMAYAGTVTVLLLSVWYILGIIIGVYVVKRINERRKLSKAKS